MTSQHAKQRIQQRGIPPLIVTWLLDFGKQRHDHHGGVVHYFDKQSRRNLERQVGRRVLSRLSGYLDSYVVISTDDALVTVGHRYKRFNLS